MKVVLDCRYTRIGRHDGISRYTASIATELAKLHPVTMLISDRRQLDLLPDLPWAMTTSPTSPLEPFVAFQVNKLRPDIVFSPMQTMGSLGRRYRLVLTVHDLIYYRHRTPPRDLPAFVRLLWRLYHLAWWPQRILLNRADAIVTVSETTRDHIRAKKLTRRPVTVVRNAAPVTRPASIPDSNRASARSLVYMGSYMPYKNVETLTRALHHLPSYKLHLMSKVDDDTKARLRGLAPESSLIFHNGASDEEYVTTLSQATALVSASKDEGFGIPLVEAMSLGTPIVVSDIPIFREIGGDAASYVGPTSPTEFAHAIRELEAPATWDCRSVAGRRQSAEFSWGTSAQTLLDVLRTVHDASSG